MLLKYFFKYLLLALIFNIQFYEPKYLPNIVIKFTYSFFKSEDTLGFWFCLVYDTGLSGCRGDSYTTSSPLDMEEYFIVTYDKSMAH